MAKEQSRFFDSVGGDTKYSAEQFAAYFRVLISSGILGGGTNLQVIAGTGMSVKVQYGIGNILGYMYWLEDDGMGDFSAALTASSPQPRIDRIILRLDKALNERTIRLAVKSGVPAATPSAPSLEREGNVYELSLARVNVRANTASILATDIIDERYSTTTCGLMNSLIALDAGEFQQQAAAILAELASQGYIPLTDATTTPQSGKLLKVNAAEKLPVSITGDAHTLDGKTIAQILQQLAPEITEIRITRSDPTPTTQPVLWIKY